MANLSTERISFEQALANLLNLYGVDGSTGSGTILPERLSLINYVKAKLDEIVPEGEGVQFAVDGDVNISDPLNLLINAILDEAAKRTLINAPIEVIDPAISEETTGTEEANDDKIGYIPLADNFLRFHSLKMTEWERPVFKAIRMNDPQYYLQKNKYTRGGISKPKAALGRRRIISVPAVTNTVETIVEGDIKRGALYNWLAIANVPRIYAENAHVPTIVEWGDLVQAVGDTDASGNNTAGGKLKETGTTYWDSPNEGATNEYGFNARGTGLFMRNQSGTHFNYLNIGGWYWTSTAKDVNTSYYVQFDSRYNRLMGAFPQFGLKGAYYRNYNGLAIRLIVDTPIEIDGSDAIYVGNDGRRYRCKLMPDGKWWMVENLMETQYRDGSPITIESDITAFESMTTGAMTYYNGDRTIAITTTVISETELVTPAVYADRQVVEYYSVDTAHTIDWLYYIPERSAQDIQSNLVDALTWIAAGMVLQITERTDLARAAFEQETASYNRL